MFRLTADFPAYLPHAPELMIDSLKYVESNFSVPDPDDSLHWEIEFPGDFTAGRHVLTLKVDEHTWNFDFVVTGNELVARTFCFPNPFRDGTNIIYTLNLPVDSGTLKIYNVSGTLIRSFDLGSDMLDAANFGSPHSIYWNGRDSAGSMVANGTYIYLLHFVEGGRVIEVTGKSVRLR
ncbi:hypothetical protein DRQ05_03640 [bacterium]|nr:MAG: hypothetical protein DRQ05_03640 [bacterium]